MFDQGGEDPTMTVEDVIQWVRDNPTTAQARIGTHVGYLTVRTVGRGEDWRRSLYLRDQRRGPRSQYRYITPHVLDRVEIKVGHRYRPVAEVVGAS